jgi:hypothetical protein
LRIVFHQKQLHLPAIYPRRKNLPMGYALQLKRPRVGHSSKIFHVKQLH